MDTDKLLSELFFKAIFGLNYNLLEFAQNVGIMKYMFFSISFFLLIQKNLSLLNDSV